MGKRTGMARAKAHRLKGMKKESDGIALGDERMKAEGRQEQEAARQEEERVRALREASDR
ncbi:hypothetical protein ABZ154_17370 [Streptomyces sp. NPDC006261]|uniref:hypothetical protein n=1 Tax=Streptomyces sp. NPDC006261 TaxID=3156739 RepID=UPI0033A43CE1